MGPMHDRFVFELRPSVFAVKQISQIFHLLLIFFQGVLLLNACLTVRQGQPNSHKDRGWEKLTDAVVKYIRFEPEHISFRATVPRISKGQI